MTYMEIEELKDKTLVKIENKDNEELFFHTTDGDIYKMYHAQDCCESVTIEEIIGDLEDLIGSPLIMAEEASEEGERSWGTMTWTFYKFATINGYVTIRWLGESNGYYSESVNIRKLEEF